MPASSRLLPHRQQQSAVAERHSKRVRFTQDGDSGDQVTVHVLEIPRSCVVASSLDSDTDANYEADSGADVNAGCEDDGDCELDADNDASTGADGDEDVTDIDLQTLNMTSNDASRMRSSTGHANSVDSNETERKFDDNCADECFKSHSHGNRKHRFSLPLALPGLAARSERSADRRSRSFSVTRSRSGRFNQNYNFHHSSTSSLSNSAMRERESQSASAQDASRSSRSDLLDVQVMKELTGAFPMRPIRSSFARSIVSSSATLRLRRQSSWTIARSGKFWINGEVKNNDGANNFESNVHARRLRHTADVEKPVLMMPMPMPMPMPSLIRSSQSDLSNETTTNDGSLRATDWLIANGLKNSRDSLDIRPLFS